MENFNFKKEWEDLCDKIGIEPDYIMFDELMSRYTESHRYYHNQNHLEAMLLEFENITQIIRNYEAVLLAIWFHDAIYDTHAKDNEERSAKLFSDFALEKNLSHDLSAEVVRLILATKHDKIYTDIDAQILNDIDLSIFGNPRSEFLKYEENIRKEYSWRNDNTYKKERLKVLTFFIGRLDNRRIYQTSHFENKYGEDARKNITQLIGELN